MKRPSCSECQWVEVTPHLEIGVVMECRRYPPISMPEVEVIIDDETGEYTENEVGVDRVYPLVGELDWCGEFVSTQAHAEKGGDEKSGGQLSAGPSSPRD